MLARGWRPGFEVLLPAALGRGGVALKGGRGGSASGWRGALALATRTAPGCCWGFGARPWALQLLQSSRFLLPAAPRRPPFLDLKMMPHTHALMDGSTCGSSAGALGPASWRGGVVRGLTRWGGEAAAAFDDADVVDHVSLESEGTQIGDRWVPGNSGHAMGMVSKSEWAKTVLRPGRLSVSPQTSTSRSWASLQVVTALQWSHLMS